MGVLSFEERANKIWQALRQWHKAGLICNYLAAGFLFLQF
jgi:hypothetical protein